MMNDNASVKIGEYPHYDNDLGSVCKQLTKKLQRGVLSGEYMPEGLKELQMIRDFKESKLSVDEYIKQVCT